VRVILTFFSSWTNWIWHTKINWLHDVILLHPIVLVPWGKFLLCHTPIKPISTFRDQISILIVGCMTTWSWGSHHFSHPPIQLFFHFILSLRFSQFILGPIWFTKSCFLSKLSCVCLLLEKLVNGKHFQSKKNLAWFPEKYFPFILGEKYFLEVVKKLEISCYLLIISNLVL
jgi:hypothetical protein